MNSLETNAEQLLRWMSGYPSCLVAFSGGVDSAVVATAAASCPDTNAIAVTADSPSLPSGELQAAREIAESIGIRHIVIQTKELQRSQYVANAGDRCYWCKTELYQQISRLPEADGAVVLNGTNTDDLGDYRPGLASAREHRVLSPLVECGLNKAAVRELARFWKLSNWDKPAGPCLASRISPGVQVTPERLQIVDLAENFLRSLGFEVVRVRWHEGPLARIEINPNLIAKVVQPDVSTQIQQHFKSLGFKFVTVDLAGFRSGSLNDLVPIDTLQSFSRS